MSRKHYKRIAEAVATLQLGGATKSVKKQEYIKAIVAQQLANALRGTNPRFDSARFYRACVNKQ